MMQVIRLSCPSCGGALDINSNLDKFACAYCGTALSAVRRGGTVSLNTEILDDVRIGTNRTAAELALTRLEKELKKLDKELSSFSRPDIRPDPINEDRQEYIEKYLKENGISTPSWFCKLKAALGSIDAYIEIKEWELACQKAKLSYRSLVLYMESWIRWWDEVPVLETKRDRILKEIEANRRTVSITD